MNKIAIVTATRAEYGLLYPVICALRRFESETLRVELLVTGTHLSERYGSTVEEIEMDKSRVRVVVSMFGRETPVDLDFDQVEAVEK